MHLETLYLHPVAGMDGDEVGKLIFTPEGVVDSRVFALVEEDAIQAWLDKPQDGPPARLTLKSTPNLVNLKARNHYGSLLLSDQQVESGKLMDTGIPLALEQPQLSEPPLENPNQLKKLAVDDFYNNLLLPVKASSSSTSIRWAEVCHPGVSKWISEKLGKAVVLVKAVDHPDTQKHHFTWYSDLHLITSASLQALIQTAQSMQAAIDTPINKINPRTFRAQGIIAETIPFEETAWIEQMLILGGVPLAVELCERCGYLSVDPAKGKKTQVPIHKAVAQIHGNKFGMYVKPPTAGEIMLREGDEVQVASKKGT